MILLSSYFTTRRLSLCASRYVAWLSPPEATPRFQRRQSHLYTTNASSRATQGVVSKYARLSSFTSLLLYYFTMPHSDHSASPSRKVFADLPPFPDNVPTAPLLRISLDKLLRGDPQEEARCWEACCELGFFYLDLRSSDSNSHNGTSVVDGGALLQDANSLFEVMKDFYDLDVEEKIKYDFKDQGSYFGYKGYGEGVIDRHGTKDRNEFYNVCFHPFRINTTHAYCRSQKTTSSVSAHRSPPQLCLTPTAHCTLRTPAPPTPCACSSPRSSRRVFRSRLLCALQAVCPLCTAYSLCRATRSAS